MIASARSYLYVPADDPVRARKAVDRGADAIVLDLEDGVAPSRKRVAQANVAELLPSMTSAGQIWVRVNYETIDADLQAVAVPGLTGVFVPKADPAALHEVEAILTERELALSLPPGAYRVVALVETAKALQSCGELAAAERVLRLGMGEADLAAELGLLPGPDRAELWPARLQVVVASAAEGKVPPVGSVETSLGDDDALEAGTRQLLRQGFRARTAIHPAQLATINAVFTPTGKETQAARDVVDRFEQAEQAGNGVAVSADGRMLDLAVVRSARDVLARAEAASRSRAL